MCLTASLPLKMLDCNGFTHRDDRFHGRSRSRSCVSPAPEGETPAEWEERRLAKAAAPVAHPAVVQVPEQAPAEATPAATAPASPRGPPEQAAVTAQSPSTPPGEARGDASGEGGRAAGAPVAGNEQDKYRSNV